MKNKPIINLTKISKQYLSHTSTPLQVLNVFDLKIYEGEHVGLLGDNGAGKSTLLKIIAGITKPTTGSVKALGKIVSILDLESGFHPDLTGRENIQINGLLSGMTATEIQKKQANIIKYSGIGHFIDQPFYTYSSGMKFRLAFATVIHSNADVLIIDELFFSGDLYFQRKVLQLIISLQNNTNITTIITSHVPVYLQLLANKYFMIKNGDLKLVTSKYVERLAQERSQFYRKTITELNG